MCHPTADLVDSNKSCMLLWSARHAQTCSPKAYINQNREKLFPGPPFFDVGVWMAILYVDNDVDNHKSGHTSRR